MEAQSVLVLVAEDEPLIAMTISETLEDAGHSVRVAASGDAALAALDAMARDVSALVTDIRLEPGKTTGWELARRGRELKPDLPVVYVTGDSGHEWASKGVPNSLILQKPFAPAQIVTAVSQLLNGAATAIVPSSLPTS